MFDLLRKLRFLMNIMILGDGMRVKLWVWVVASSVIDNFATNDDFSQLISFKFEFEFRKSIQLITS
jgi:hypothetical protein